MWHLQAVGKAHELWSFNIVLQDTRVVSYVLYICPNTPSILWQYVYHSYSKTNELPISEETVFRPPLKITWCISLKQCRMRNRVTELETSKWAKMERSSPCWITVSRLISIKTHLLPWWTALTRMSVVLKLRNDIYT